MLMVAMVLGVSSVSFAQMQNTDEDNNALDELDPFSQTIESDLNQMDFQYNLETGNPVFDLNSLNPFTISDSSCFQLNCHIYAQVIKSTQVIYIYIDGQLTYTWRVSSGSPGRDTPNLNQHPNGRIYDAYTSKKFPGGDYKGLGNMPYAVFISGGIAIHGTSLGNVKKLGQPVSHGCIRIHPENAKIFNGLVRAAGVSNVWVSVQN